jgi:hypothetical protein
MLDTMAADSFVSFGSGWYKNVKAEKIPKEPTQFDRVLEYINKILKVKIKSFVKKL